MLIISFWLCPKCAFILLYTTLNLKTCKINIEKVRDVSKEGGGGGGEYEQNNIYTFNGLNLEPIFTTKVTIIQLSLILH